MCSSTSNLWWREERERLTRCQEADAKDWHEDPVLRFPPSPLTNWETRASHFDFTIKRNMIIFLLQILIIEVVVRIHESRCIRRLRVHRFKKSCKKNLEGRFRYSPRSQWWARNGTLVSGTWSSVLIISTLPLLSRIKERAFIFPHYKNTLNYLWRFFFFNHCRFIYYFGNRVCNEGILTSLSVWTVLQEQAEKPLRYKQDSGLSATSTNCLFSFQSDRKLLEFHTSFYIQIEVPGESILHVNSFPGYKRKLSNSKTLRDII